MSTLRPRVVLDNTVLSTFQEARVLSRILEFWPGRWLVPLEVQGEAAAWKAHGASVLATLTQLQALNVVELTAVDPRLEGRLFAQLARRLGQGESAAIAIAFHRQLEVALGDRRARRACDQLLPRVPWISTEAIISHAVIDGHLTYAEADAIWKATGIRDPSRGIPWS